MEFIHKVSALNGPSVTQWLTTANTRLPGMVTVVMVIAIAWLMARFIWVLAPIETEFDWSTKPVAGGSVTAPSDAPPVNISAVVNAHIFGVAGAEPVTAKAIDAPETRLNLKLRGTVAAGDDALTHAIIADDRGNDAVYFLNDTVPGGAVLHEVYPDRVILNRAGTLEALKLPRLSESLGNQTASRPALAPSVPDTGSVQDLMEQNGGSFTDILRPQPYMPNGELRGYRVYPGRDRRRFAALGLRPGDLVTDINGTPLNNLQSGMDVFRNLGASSQLTVTIERNGSPLSLTLDTSQFSNLPGATQ